MTLADHPYGRPYLHIPTNKVVYLQNKYSDGTYQAHFQYRESMIVHPDDLDYALLKERLSKPIDEALKTTDINTLMRDALELLGDNTGYGVEDRRLFAQLAAQVQ